MFAVGLPRCLPLFIDDPLSHLLTSPSHLNQPPAPHANPGSQLLGVGHACAQPEQRYIQVFPGCPSGACGAPSSEGHNWMGEWESSERAGGAMGDVLPKALEGGSGVQSPGKPGSQHDKGSAYQPMFIEPKSTEHKMGREPDGAKASSGAAHPPGDEKTETRRDGVPGPRAGGSPRHARPVAAIPSHFPLLFFRSITLPTQRLEFRWNVTGLSERPGPKGHPRLAVITTSTATTSTTGRHRHLHREVTAYSK